MNAGKACALSNILGITGIEGGFPHSEIRGSKVVRTSPRLIAAYHVLHRLSAPRHPPDTLIALDRSHYRCPSRRVALGRETRARRPLHPETTGRTRSKDQFCFKHIRERRSGDVHCWLCSLRVRISRSPKAPRSSRSQRPDMFTLHDVRYLRHASWFQLTGEAV